MSDNTYKTASSEAQRQLCESIRQARIDEVECVVPDIAGIARGKVMPATKFSDKTHTYLPVSIFYQTITGGYAEPQDDENFETETDLLLVPDPATMRAVPWTREPSCQIIHDLYWRNGDAVGCAPRNVLKRVIGLYHESGLKPVVAPELEFYLTKPNPDPNYPLEPPVGRSGRQGAGRQALSISAVDEYENVIEDIYNFAEAQGLDIDTIVHEGGAAQIEINLRHADPLSLADQVFVFKRTIREAALRNGAYATFMAKPMENEPGSAMHVHQSVVEAATGRNIFNSEKGVATPEFSHFIAGQQRYLPAATPIVAPYVNSYRRWIPSDSAPINLAWGYDNRSVGLRVPTPISAPEARRVENRIVGADANPYLAFAACLAAGFLGLKEKHAPAEPVSGNAYNLPHELPRGLLEGLALFRDCDTLQDALGTHFSRVYLAVKMREFEEFMRVVSPWEREHLLLNV